MPLIDKSMERLGASHAGTWKADNLCGRLGGAPLQDLCLSHSGLSRTSSKGAEHEALMHEPLELRQQGRALLPVEFHVLLGKEGVTIRIAPVR